MVYSSGNERLTGKHPIKTAYYFFRHAIFRNKNLEIDSFDALGRINVSNLEKNYDIVLLPDISIAVSLALAGIRNSNIPVIGCPGDPQTVLIQDMIGLTDNLKVDWLFNFYSPASFYEYYPKRFRYEVVHIGLESSLCTSETLWADRTPDKIAISGILDKPDLLHKMYYRVYLKRPKAQSTDFYYKLRTKCNKLPYTIHTRDIYPDQSTDQLHGILSGFRAAVAAMTTYPTIKYKETPAAGCLTFMEITERNHGTFLGYKDGKSAVFIDESNYKKKFQEYLDSSDDPRWERIAREGRRYTLDNLSNDRGVEMLVRIMRKALGEENVEI